VRSLIENDPKRPREAPVMTATFRSDLIFAPSRDQHIDERTVIIVEAMRLCIACSLIVISCGETDADRYIDNDVRISGCGDIARVSDPWLAGTHG
jgi:hypothetical protein